MAEMTETIYNVSPNLGGRIMKFKCTAAANGDFIVFPYPVGCVKAVRNTGADAATVYATAALHTDGIASATSTSALYDGATTLQMPASGYVMCEEEIIKYSGVTPADTAGTLTLDARACFGTEAAAHAVDVALYVLNTVVFTTVAGPMRGIADVIEE